MADTLYQITGAAGIPEAGVRIGYLVPILFLLGIAILLTYFRMKESDRKAGI